MKLYWRIKRNGKWTWRPAVTITRDDDVVVKPLEEDKE